VSWRLSRQARVVVTIETKTGEVLRTLARRRYPAGERTVVWNGLDRQRKAVKGGRYVARVVAGNELGTVELLRDIGVQRIAGPPQPPKVNARRQ